MAPRGQFNSNFVVGLWAQRSQVLDFSHYHLQAANQMRGARNSSTSDCISVGPAIAGAFRSDLEVIAFNLSPI